MGSADLRSDPPLSSGSGHRISSSRCSEEIERLAPRVFFFIKALNINLMQQNGINTYVLMIWLDHSAALYDFTSILHKDHSRNGLVLKRNCSDLTCFECFE